MDVIIIGGGLAGLTAAIHLRKLNYQVILFEKESYPHHKVCGEYLSKEVLPYLNSLDMDLFSLHPVSIDKLNFSTQKGKEVNIKLPLGGLGISRYALDHYLFQKAKSTGIEIIKGTIIEVKFNKGIFNVSTEKNISYSSKIVLGAYGKRSNIDKYLNRNFIQERSTWLAVKAHYQIPNFPDNLVALHNFEGGYCGLSKTETGNINVCYLASYKSFKKYKDPETFRKMVLFQNPILRKFFSEAQAIFEEPLSIAQISFDPKTTTEDHILMLGDAAGLIHPLSGNGMAMAIHSANIASEAVDGFFKNRNMDFKQLERNYSSVWNNTFHKRLTYGKWLQKIMLNKNLAEASTSLIVNSPFLIQKIIKQTHGKPIE